MKILTAPEMRAADEATFSKIGVPSRTVMESAGRHTADFITENFTQDAAGGVLVVAGAGNNGGDGYVIARALQNIGIRVTVLALKAVGELKGDALSAANAYLASGGALVSYSDREWPAQEKKLRGESWGLVVDAVLGTGLSGEVRGPARSGIEFINSISELEKIPVVSVDVPSGIDSETGAICGVAVLASATVALQCLKPGHISFPASDSCGHVYLADIGIGAVLPEISEVRRELVGAEQIIGYLNESRALKRDAHKGRRGHVLVVGGAQGKLGAPQLSGQAALHAGAGLVTIALPESAARKIIPSLKELMGEPLPELKGEFSELAVAKLLPLLTEKDAVVIGPGMGEGPGAEALLKATMEYCKREKCGLVIDADGLNLLAVHRGLLDELPENSVLTPHPGEMARLVGKSSEEIQANRFEYAREFSVRHHCVTVLKGARTVTADASGGLFVNLAATAVLATAGSGDSLAGIIGALMAQGLTPSHAAIAGVYVHGIAGEVLERRAGGVFGIVATDISSEVARVLNTLQKQSHEEPVKKFLQQVIPDPWASQL